MLNVLWKTHLKWHFGDFSLHISRSFISNDWSYGSRLCYYNIVWCMEIKRRNAIRHHCIQQLKMATPICFSEFVSLISVFFAISVSISKQLLQITNITHIFSCCQSVMRLARNALLNVQTKWNVTWDKN